MATGLAVLSGVAAHPASIPSMAVAQRADVRQGLNMQHSMSACASELFALTVAVTVSLH